MTQKIQFLIVFLLFGSALFSQEAVKEKKLVNFGFQKFNGNRKISSLIIHSTFNASFPNTAKPDSFSVDGVLKQFKKYKVSAHYLIDRNGVIHQLVNDNDVSWHAGKGVLPNGNTNINSTSIGIEIMCTYNNGPNEKQYNALQSLIHELDSKYKFKYILRHSDIAPGRKTDPWNFTRNDFFRK